MIDRPWVTTLPSMTLPSVPHTPPPNGAAMVIASDTSARMISPNTPHWFCFGGFAAGGLTSPIARAGS